MDSWSVCLVSISSGISFFALSLSLSFLVSISVFVTFSLYVSLFLFLLVLQLKIIEKLWIGIERIWEIEKQNSGHTHKHQFYVHSTNVYWAFVLGSGSVLGIVKSTKMQLCSFPSRDLVLCINNCYSRRCAVENIYTAMEPLEVVIYSTWRKESLGMASFHLDLEGWPGVSQGLQVIQTDRTSWTKSGEHEGWLLA